MKKVTVSNSLQEKYSYLISEPKGKNFDPEFKPELTPKEMLHLGVFGGHYFLDEAARKEFPASWFKVSKLSKTGEKEAELNYYGVSASKPLPYWKQKGWIHRDDPHGWFQWYCRYYFGRRHPDDERQIKRWKAFTRHIGQIKKNCTPGDMECRPKQRQALLHWAYDSRKM